MEDASFALTRLPFCSLCAFDWADVDARRKRRFGRQETAMWKLMDVGPRNTVIVLKSRSAPFRLDFLNPAMQSMQRRHPFLHSVLLSVPLLGPYFAIIGNAIEVTEYAAREITDDSAEATFQRHLQTIIDTALNAKFHAHHREFLTNLSQAQSTKTWQEKKKAAGEYEGEVLSESQVANQIPQHPLIRASIVNGPPGLGQALVIALPSIIADAVSSTNLVKELLEQAKVVEQFVPASSEDIPPEPLYLHPMRAMDEFYPASVFGRGAFFALAKSNIRWLKYFRSMSIKNQEQFKTWIPDESRSVRSLMAELPQATLEALRTLAAEHDVSLTHILTAASVAATHEVFFPNSDSALLATQVTVDLRPLFDAPISAKHLGQLTGRAHGRISSAVGSTLWDIAKEVKSLDSQVPGEVFRTFKWQRTLGWDRQILASRPPSQPLSSPLMYTAPVNISHCNTLDLSDGVLEHYSIDSAQVLFGHTDNTRYTSFSALPNGKLGISITFPDIVFKRPDITDYLNSVCQHIQDTAEGK